MAAPVASGDDAVMATLGGQDERRHSRWIWVSAALAVAAAGLGIWAYMLSSDLDETRQELDTTKQELASANQQLDKTKQQLATAQQDVEDLGLRHPGESSARARASR